MNSDSRIVESNETSLSGDIAEDLLQSVLPNAALPYYEMEVNAVHESIQDAIQLLQQYSEDFSMKTSDPDQVFEHLDQARNRIASAVDTLEKAVHGTDEKRTDDGKEKEVMPDPTNVGLSEQEQMRVAYLNMITDAFADVLENLRSKDDADPVIDLDILADCLQSGYDLLTMLGQNDSSAWSESDFLWNDENDDWVNESAADAELTPHEVHRQELGFQLIN